MIDSNLLDRINGRRVIIDACVSRDFANGLRNTGLVVRHVADINSALKDQEIAMMMHADEVLITRDHRFYRMLGQARAILLTSGSNTVGKNIVDDKPAKRKTLARRKSRLPSHVRMALKEKLAEEARTGLLSMKILWGIIWLML